MTKGKALALGILCAITTIGLLVNNFNPCMYPFAVGAVLCLGLWFSKYQRDRRFAQAGRATSPVIPEAPADDLSDEMFAHMSAGSIPIGYHPETGNVLYLSNTDRQSGTYITGVQGSGKSGLIQGMVMQDVTIGNSVIVIDPHADTANACVAQLDDEDVPRVSVLDMQDEDHPFGLNVFAGGNFANSIQQAQAINRVRHIFETQWPEIASQQNLPRYLLAATITLFANPGSTLVDMHQLFIEDSFRQQKLRNVADPTVQQFWQTQYEELSPSARLQRVEPLIARLESLFMGRSLVRNIVGQRENTIDFRRAIENKEIILIKLPVKTLGQDAYLIGKMIIAQIHAAIFSFADMLPQDRPSFGLYVDEVQHFATPDFTEMFTEGRKFGVRVTIAHQYRNQLPSYLLHSTMTARTKICFQVTPEDSRELAPLFIGGESHEH